LLNGHHIALDFWSLLIVAEELGSVYSGLRAGKPAALAPLSRRYEDYVSAEREFLAGPEGERLWDYWRDRLRGTLPTLYLPLDRPAPQVQSFRGKATSFKLDRELSLRLRELARTEQTTLNTLLLAGFKVLLARLCGQEEILVGSPTAGRQSADLADVVGYFVNPIVVRSTVGEAVPFRSLLKSVRETLIGALKHQEYPFPLLVERLKPLHLFLGPLAPLGELKQLGNSHRAAILRDRPLACSSG